MRLLSLCLLASLATSFRPMRLPRRPLLRMASPEEQLTTGGLALRGALARLEDQRRKDRPPPPDGLAWRTSNAGAWVLAPEDAPVWAVLHFAGGFGIGQYPQLCYDALLRKVCAHPNFGRGLAVVATPYDATKSLDHDGLSRKIERSYEDTLAEAQEEWGWRPQSNLAELRLGHSLGGKLLLLQRLRELEMGMEGKKPSALAVTGFNNAPLSDSLSFVQDLIKTYGGGGASAASSIPSPLLDILQNVATSLGFDFTPTALQTELRTTTLLEAVIAAAEERGASSGNLDAEGEAQQEAQRRSEALAEAVQWLPLFLRLKDDELDTSDQLIRSLPLGLQDLAYKYRVQELPGNHLTPAYLELSAEDVRKAAGDAGDMRDFFDMSQINDMSFKWMLGDTAGVGVLAEAIANWAILEAKGVPQLPASLEPSY